MRNTKLLLKSGDSGTFRYNSLGAVYIAEDDDYACGSSIEYIESKLESASDKYLQKLQQDPAVIIAFLDQYEAIYEGSPEEYRNDKYNILAQFNMIHSRSSNDFYERNMDILKHVYVIAGNNENLNATLLHWAHSTSSVETMIKKIVQCKNSKVIFKGAPYEGLAGLILSNYYRPSNGRSISYINKTDDDYQEKLEIIHGVIREIQHYLNSLGIHSEYSDRQKVLIADQEDFN